MTDIIDVTMDDANSIPVVPVPHPNRGAIRGIPLGAHLIAINWEGGDPPHVGGITWTKEQRDSAIEQLDDEEDRFDGTFMIYVKPEMVVNPNVDGVPDPMEVINTVAARRLMPDCPPDLLPFMVEVVTEARKGLVQNPF